MFFVFLIIVVFLIAIDTSYDKTEELNKNILKRFSGRHTLEKIYVYQEKIFTKVSWEGRNI